MMRRLLVGFLVTLGSITLLLMIGGGILAWLAHRDWQERAALPERIVLELDLRGNLPEAPQENPLALLESAPSLTLSDAVLALDAATRDERVRGAFVRIAETSHGFAKAQELRAALERLSDAGKPVVGWADSFGELTPGSEGYLIASAFDELTLQPGGFVGLTGVGFEIPFVRDLLDRLGVEPRVFKRAEFKTALDSFTERGLTTAHRDMLESMVDGLFDQLVRSIADGRSLSPEVVERLIDDAPLTSDASLAAGLIDREGYLGETYDGFLDRQNGEAVSLAGYASSLKPAEEPAAQVALVRGAGMIVRSGNPLDNNIVGDRLAAAIHTAAEDDDIDALLVRLDTGGGSAVASETVAHEIERVKNSGKPVIVTMGNAAASGGYWISAPADHIVAQPTTFTGSIGVIAGRPVLADALDELGINTEAVVRGENAQLWSLAATLDNAAASKIDQSVGGLYDTFVTHVASSRGMSNDDVEQVARGRVWLGATAVDNGLVDSLGGIHEALAQTREALGLGADADLAVQPYPRPRTPLEQIVSLADLPIELGTWLSWLRASMMPLGTAQMPELGRQLH